ncbi:MAG: hypothetical protein JJ975_00300 [Bacteroidia bacterium]|nr:hypothetical protein [Bacteroidia bacterium]
MKTIFTCVLLGINFCLLAQDTVSMQLDLTEPRVGQEVTLSFPIDFLTQEVQNQLGDSISVVPSRFGLYNQGSPFKRTIKFHQPGNYIVGPFRFDINGERIQTDSQEVVVKEKLPLQEGFWVRLIQNGSGDNEIVLEQQIADSNVFRDPEGRMEVTSLVEEPQPGVQFYLSRHAITTVQRGLEQNEVPLHYSFTQYRVVFDSEVEGITLQPWHFSHLKEEIPSLEIKR